MPEVTYSVAADAQKLLDAAREEANRQGVSEIGVEHLLSAIVKRDQAAPEDASLAQWNVFLSGFDHPLTADEAWQLIYSLLHDLKSLLFLIIGYLELIPHVPNPDDSAKILRRTEANARMIVKMVDSVYPVLKARFRRYD